MCRSNCFSFYFYVIFRKSSHKPGCLDTNNKIFVTGVIPEGLLFLDNVVIDSFVRNCVPVVPFPACIIKYVLVYYICVMFQTKFDNLYSCRESILDA